MYTPNVVARIVVVSLCVFAIITGCRQTDQTVTHRDGQPPVVGVEQGDPEMQAAIQKAQATLDEFVTALQRPGDRVFAIKAAMPTPDGSHEHIWVGSVAYADGVFTGTIDNEPVNLPNIKLGQQVQIPRAHVSDWLILNGEEMRGGYTIEILSKRSG
jgi:uncharacterized protein YegJ (DUF2314 family)